MTASWLLPAQSAGPRMPRSGFVGPARFATCRPALDVPNGPVISTETSWIDAGLPGMEIRQWLYEQHLLALRDALISTTAKLRREHRASCLAMAQLRAVTNECLAMGSK